jgi:hypothetical protein
MLRHIVLISWSDGTTPEQVAAVSAALDALPPAIETIRSYTHGPDLGLGAPRYDYAIVADFDDAAGWQVYDRHELHERARAEVIVPHVAQRASVQFELR